MGKWRLIGALVAAVGLALGAAACSDDNDDKGGEPTASTSGEPLELAIMANDAFSFNPSQITLTAGQAVHLTLDNSNGAILHDFTVEGMPAMDISSEGAEHQMDATEMPGGGHMATDMPGDGHMDGAGEVHVAADPGGMGTLEFTPTEPGEYVFYCTVAGHREAGMQGTITVE